MNGEKEHNVRSLPKEKCTALSEQNGWSIAFSEGYVNGKTERRRGNPLSCYLTVGVDQYALGFSAGYFERQNLDRGAGRQDGKSGIKQGGGNVSLSNLVLS
jgi:hypothetical protein